MKRIILAVLVISGLLAAPTTANEPAKMVSAPLAKVTGSPLTDLSAAPTINLSITGFPTKAGLYFQQCTAPFGPARPTTCNDAAQLWISTEPRANFAPTANIVFKPAASFKTRTGAEIDCRKVSCGIFIRYDHNNGTDFSEDNFIPLTFNVNDNTPTLPSDEITASIGGVVVNQRNPLTMAYRAPGLLVATAKSGAALSFKSYTPACSIVDGVVTALKGTGACAIGVNSPGTATYGPIEVQLPIYLKPGNDGILNKAYPTTLKIRKSAVLKNESLFGEKLKFKTASKTCSVYGSKVIALRKGACVLSITGPAVANLFAGVKETHTITIQ
jgi:hypothetical protein